jgi:polysaccharide biosynthesis protein PslG
MRTPSEIARGCLVAAFAVLLIAVPVASTAAPTSTEHGVNRAKLSKRAERVIERRNGIEVLKISRCGPRRLTRGRLDYSRWICEWRAEGEYPGQVPYHCAGKARWNRPKGNWRVDRCANRMQPYAPLLDTPNPHPMFGFNDDWSLHLLHDTTAHATSVLDRIDGTGANVIRMGLYWSGVELTPGGSPHWEEYDELNSLFESRGLRPLWMVIGAPCWAQKDPCSTTVAPPAAARADDYGRFAATVARRYPRSAGIEIWNEPNYPRFWGGDRPDPGLYAAMLTSAAAQIHAAVPSMPVVSGGLSPHGEGDGGAIGFREYLERLYELGAAQRADAIGFHPYPGVGPTEDYIAAVRIQFGKIQIEMREAGDSAPVWATEYGVSTTGPQAFPPAAQGPALAELYEIFRRIDRIDLAIVHRMIDVPSLAGREAGFGVLDEALKAKPALCSVSLVRGLAC